MSDDVEEVANTFMQNPIHISVTEEEFVFKSIPHHYIWAVNDDGRLQTLVELYMRSAKTCFRLVIFTKDNHGAELLRKSLTVRPFLFFRPWMTVRTKKAQEKYEKILFWKMSFDNHNGLFGLPT